MKCFLLFFVLGILGFSFSMLGSRAQARLHWESYTKLQQLKVSFLGLHSVVDQVSLVLKAPNEAELIPVFSPEPKPNTVLCASARFKDLINSSGSAYPFSNNPNENSSKLGLPFDQNTQGLRPSHPVLGGRAARGPAHLPADQRFLPEPPRHPPGKSGPNEVSPLINS